MPTIVQEIETDLRRRIADLEVSQGLREAIGYAVLGRGKRLRPALTLLSCDAVGGERDDARAAAAALELVHTFSLVHDDLPAMDDDDLRRGRPTLHIHAGEAMAVLTGDMLLSLAFEWITLADTTHDATRRIVRELARGTAHMISGQVYDTLGDFPPQSADVQRLALIHRNKTAALVGAACRIGAICGNGSTEQIQELSDYGEAVGMMFQIVDDLLDVTQTSEHIGKTAGKDGPAGKLTFPGVHGTRASREEIESLRCSAHDALKPLGEPAQPLRELCDYMAVRTR